MAGKHLKPEFRDSQNRKITINSRVFYYTCSSFSYVIKNFRPDMLKNRCTLNINKRSVKLMDAARNVLLTYKICKTT